MSPKAELLRGEAAKLEAAAVAEEKKENERDTHFKKIQDELNAERGKFMIEADRVAAEMGKAVPGTVTEIFCPICKPWQHSMTIHAKSDAENQFIQDTFSIPYLPRLRKGKDGLLRCPTNKDHVFKVI